MHALVNACLVCHDILRITLVYPIKCEWCFRSHVNPGSIGNHPYLASTKPITNELCSSNYIPR